MKNVLRCAVYVAALLADAAQAAPAGDSYMQRSSPVGLGLLGVVAGL